MFKNKVVLKTIALCTAVVLSFTAFVFSICNLVVEDTVKYGIVIDEEDVTNKNANNIIGNNRVKYNERNNTLILNNAVLDGDEFGILASRDLTIEVRGQNVIKVDEDDESVAGIALFQNHIMYDVTFVGKGTLNIISEDTIGYNNFGIYADTVTINGPTINIALGNASANGGSSVGVSCNNFVMHSGELTVETGVGEESLGLVAYDDINVFDGSMFIIAHDAELYSKGVYSGGNFIMHAGDVSVSGGNVVHGDSYGIETIGNFILHGGSVFAYAGESEEYFSEGIQCGGNFIVNNGEVSAYGLDGQESYGIVVEGNFNVYGEVIDVIEEPGSEFPTYVFDSNIWAESGNATGDSVGLYVNGNISLEGAIVEVLSSVSAEGNSYGTLVENNFDGKSGEFYSVANEAAISSQGIKCNGNMILEGAIVSGEANVAEVAYGVFVNGNLIVTSGDVIGFAVEESTSNYGVYIMGDSIVYDGGISAVARVSVNGIGFASKGTLELLGGGVLFQGGIASIIEIDFNSTDYSYNECYTSLTPEVIEAYNSANLDTYVRIIIEK